MSYQDKVEIGNCTLYLGDCIEVMQDIPEKSINSVITDPPYVFGLASVSGGGNPKISKWGDLLNHSYFYREVFGQCQRLISPDGCFWTFINWRGLPVIMKAAVEADLSIASLLVWDKCWIGPGGWVGLRPSYELVTLIPFGKFAIPNRGLPDIWRHKWSSRKPHGHPSEKPESLLIELVKETPAETFLDPFMGSGTTGAACAQAGRRFIGVEIEPKYFEIAVKRIKDAYEQIKSKNIDIEE